MNNKFVYVFNKKDKDVLIQNGFSLWKEDADNNIYILIAGGSTTFSLNDIDHYETDVVPF